MHPKRLKLFAEASLTEAYLFAKSQLENQKFSFAGKLLQHVEKRFQRRYLMNATRSISPRVQITQCSNFQANRLIRSTGCSKIVSVNKRSIAEKLKLYRQKRIFPVT